MTNSFRCLSEIATKYLNILICQGYKNIVRRIVRRKKLFYFNLWNPQNAAKVQLQLNPTLDIRSEMCPMY